MYKKLENYKNELLISLMITLLLFGLLIGMHSQDISEFYFTRINLTSGTDISLISYSDYVYYLLPITAIPSMIYLYVVSQRTYPDLRKISKLIVTSLVVFIVVSLLNVDLKTSSVSFGSSIGIANLHSSMFIIVNICSIMTAMVIALKVQHHKKIFLNFLLSQVIFIVGIVLILNLINEFILMLYITITIFQSIWILCKFDEELLN